MRRGEPPPPDASVVLRTGDLDTAILVADASGNFDVYGFYGLSVWVPNETFTLPDLLAGKLKGASEVIQFRAGDLYAHDLHLWDTGQAPHYDVVYQDGATVDGLVAGIQSLPYTVIVNPYYEMMDGG
jgi:hypothetical protein